MDAAHAKALAIIEEAIYHEQASHDYYLRVAEAIHDASGSAQYRQLAQEELHHREVLEERWHRLTGKRFHFDPSKVEEDELPVPSTNATAIEALTLAMEHEQEAVEKYRHLIETAPDDESRRVYEQLAEDERQHRDWFRDRRDALQQGVRWFVETLPGALDR
ncbi:MAG: ferritin family protein [Hyphomicrobiales bacterium]